MDSMSKKVLTAYPRGWNNRQQNLQETFNKSNVDSISIATSDDYVKALMMLFKKRS